MKIADELNSIYERDDVFIPKGNLGIERRDMPQIEDKDLTSFIKWLNTKKVKVAKGKVKASKLKPIQREIRSDIVKDLANSNASKLKKPIIITKKDGYVVDGHHRWLALLEQDKNSDIEAYQVDMGIKDFLKLVKDFPEVVYKDTNNKIFNEPSREY